MGEMAQTMHIHATAIDNKGQLQKQVWVTKGASRPPAKRHALAQVSTHSRLAFLVITLSLEMARSTMLSFEVDRCKWAGVDGSLSIGENKDWCVRMRRDHSA